MFLTGFSLIIYIKFYVINCQTDTNRLFSKLEHYKVDNIEAKTEYTFKIFLNGIEHEAVLYKRRPALVGNNEKLENFFLYEGYLRDAPTTTSLRGFLKNSYFYGKLFIDDTVYYIDESHQSKKYNPVIYKTTPYMSSHQPKFNFKDDMKELKRTRKSITEKFVKFKNPRNTSEDDNSFTGKRCTLMLLIDSSFSFILHDSQSAAMQHVLFTVSEVDSVFRATDFDGDGIPDNIGFTVNEIIMLDDNSTPPYYPRYSSFEQDATEFLGRFSRFPKIANSCLGVAFTAQAFADRVLGVSYTAMMFGGICESPISGSGITTHLNSLVISSYSSSNKLPQIVLENALVHELGHSFGSRHDESDDCFGHVMSPQTFTDYTKRQHFVFSKCSKLSMMATMVTQGKCLEDNVAAFCGNGLIEAGEVCDCGMTMDCLQRDPCCLRGPGENSCGVNKKYFDCHPSQGPCCTSKCRMADLQEYGLNCAAMGEQCPCESGVCQCGVNSECFGYECHNMECTRVWTTECECPATVISNSCRTCCTLDGNCLLANETTAKMLGGTEGKTLVQQLTNTNKDFPNEKYTFKQKYCVGNDCVTLSFRKVDVGDYCIKMGSMGQCSHQFKCVDIGKQHIFPDVCLGNRPKTVWHIWIIIYFTTVYLLFN